MRPPTLLRLLAAVAVGLLVAGCAGSRTPTPAPTATRAAAVTPSAATFGATLASTAAPSATPAKAPTATPTGAMTHGRSTHTATPLAGGRVLVAGGYFDALPITLADLYDPQTGTFSATGAMATARGFGTATRLSDGRVLFAGGDPGKWNFAGSLIASAELYDPATGTFSPTGLMTTARNLHTATLLLDGRVLITGGSDTFGHAVATAELYDPATGRFSPTGSTAAARGFQTASLLLDGRVLIVGGNDQGWGAGFLASAEIYNPRTGKFTATGPMTTERASHTATVLPDGRVLIAGGASSNGPESLASAEIYNPKTGKFFPTRGPMAAARTFHAATLLADGRVLVTGGTADGWVYSGPFQASAEIYDPQTGTFSPTGPMTDERVSQTATLLPDGHVLIAGGYDGIADVTTAELYDPKTGTFSPTSPGG
jgi:hypothetical protein